MRKGRVARTRVLRDVAHTGLPLRHLRYHARSDCLSLKGARVSHPELFTMENECLSVVVSAKGAELQSVVLDGIERMWCADPEVWGRHAPLLFPFIGRLRDGWYAHQGVRIDAPVHGFCRDRVFEAERISATCVRFRTRFDEKTREVYPFDFELAVEFSLDGATVVKKHRIGNAGDTALPFEIGGHEAYSVRLHEGDAWKDYRVRIGEAGAAPRECAMFGMDEAGILRTPMLDVPLQDGFLVHTPEQLGIDTIVLENDFGGEVSLVHTASGRGVTCAFPDFPYVGIWTKAGCGDARYLCIEPWSALPDGHFSARELSGKPGVRTIAPGDACELSYAMTFF